MQRNFNFSVYFNALSLVNPNNLLTHTHTHSHLASLRHFFFSHTRAKRAVTPVNKGLLGVSFVRFFMPFCELNFKQNKNEITTILINKVMSKKQVKKSYSAPACMTIQINETTFLMDTSFPSQHRPGHHGGTISSAKASMSWEEDKDEENQDPSWED